MDVTNGLCNGRIYPASHLGWWREAKQLVSVLLMHPVVG